MRVGKNQVTGEGEIYLEPDEIEDMKFVIRGSRLDKARKFQKILTEL